MALCARSDEVALAELYDRFARTAYGMAFRVLRDEALAEDAVQDAFLAVWRGAARFLPERGKASTWILTLVLGQFPGVTGGLDSSGNLVPTADFRAIQGALLAQWLGTDPTPIIPGIGAFQLPALLK